MSAQLVPIYLTSVPPIPISRPVILIGRHPECDIRIDSAKVSRRHCCVALAYDRLVIRDLGSRNGVRVNGRVIEEVQLQPGDEVAIAHFVYRLEILKLEPARPRVAPQPTSLPSIIDISDEFIPLED